MSLTKKLLQLIQNHYSKMLLILKVQIIVNLMLQR